MAEHHSGNEEQVIGVTHDPVLRPVGILMVIVGSTWGLFAGMALRAGTLGQPLAAVSLIVLGALVAGAGKQAEQI
jgi:hypothetical protein